jgi:predicted MFS family arabinose efflux permease
MNPPPAMNSARQPDWRRWYGLAVLTVVYTSNIADRFVISTLIEPIRLEFRLSDSAVGFLTGTALAIFYTGMGLPLGVIADRVDRRKLVALSMAAWSIMTTACGMARSFTGLLVARIGVGIGEAGGTPASQSIIADLFPFSQRALAYSIFALGAALGSMLGAVAGGALAQAFGWRSAFLALGIPGVVLALVVWFSVREPPRGGSHAGAAAQPAPSILGTMRFIRSQRSLVHVLAGQTVIIFWSWGLLWWTPAFLARSLGFTTAGAGELLGVTNGIGGIAGILVGAAVIQRLGRRDPRWQSWIVAAVTLACTFVSIGFYATGSRTAATVLLWLFVPAAYLNLAPTFSLTQSLVPSQMRAVCCAIMLFGANVANLALAPQIIGFISDALMRYTGAGSESLRYALIIGSFTGFWAAYHYWAAGRELRGDLARAGSGTFDVNLAAASQPSAVSYK